MDDILQTFDTYLLTPYIYPDKLVETDPVRQAISVFLLTTVGGYILYLLGAGLIYYFFFDKRYLQHKKSLSNQVSKELYTACTSIPVMSLLTVPFFLCEVRGYSLLYHTLQERSFAYTLFSLACFVMWNDCLIYWIHRLLHHPFFYGPLHKEHHRWLVPTPFASHAFHPLDGFMQSLPYHLFVFIMPLHKWLYLLFFVAVNFWTISIHDGNYNVPPSLRPYINGAAHHTDHHLYFNFNLGQYFTLWDRIGGTYRNPSPFEKKGPLDELNKQK